ncbi:MAG: DUF3040 domain-containing protein [Microbacteriaceae bacterium]|jgi:hypothetical protein|nr:DUF3040 domain-containing protein [Microbacteriaceae bacterium]HQC93301.1 DUF3040 domain-containing protein [Microbacteriaceae bacterium]
MPLSEQEQRLLDEMERQLLQNDADVVSAPSPNHVLNYRNITIGALLVLVGLGALVVGVATQLIIVGILGFVVMLVGVVLAIKPTRVEHVVPRTSAGATSGASAKASSASFMDRMNDRWDRRNEG